MSTVLVHETAHGNITSVGSHIHTLAAPEADAALQRDAFHDDPFGDLLAADHPAIPPAKPPTPPSKPPPPRPPMAAVVTAETHTGAFALQTSAAAEDFKGDPFLALEAQPSAATSAAPHELPAAPAGTAGFGDLDDFGAASHGAASQQQPQQQQLLLQDAFGLPAQTGSSQDLFAGSFEDPFAALQPGGAGESAHAGALQEVRGGEDDFTDSSRESEGVHREDAPRTPAAHLPGLDRTGGMDMAAGAQGELAEVAPNVSTPPPPPDPARVASPPPPKSPPPRSPPPPPLQVQPRGGDVMDSFTALAAPFDESPRRQEGAMEGGMGGFVGGGMGGPGGESLHSSNSTADSLWDTLADSGSTALPSHDTHSGSPAAAAASHPADTFSPPTAVPPTTPPQAPTGDPPLSPQQPMKAAPPGGTSPPQLAHAKGPPPPPAKFDAGS